MHQPVDAFSLVLLRASRLTKLPFIVIIIPKAAFNINGFISIGNLRNFASFLRRATFVPI